MTESTLPADVVAIDLPGIPRFKSGKVREVFELEEHLLMVATDRISAFDCVLPNGIPDKGAVLNRLSEWWFNRTGHVVPNHLVTADPAAFPESLRPWSGLLADRAMLVRRTEALPVECVVRGYLIGSGWKEYRESGSVSGQRLRPGYHMADRLDEPVFTPAFKAESGHDENISFDKTVELVGRKHAETLRDISLALYAEAAAFALEKGVIIADTKFEFGLLDGQITLIDEVLTPDSSRFWDAERYAPGSSPFSYDKQFVRDYLETLDWDKTPPAPPLPPDVVARTREKYLQVFEQLTGRRLR